MATQVDIIKSDHVAQRVVKHAQARREPHRQRAMAGRHRRQGQHRSLAWRAAAEEARRQALAREQRHHHQLHRQRAQVRRGVANAFAQSYIDTNIELQGRAGAPVRRLVRRPQQATARPARSRPGAPFRLPARQGHRRHRRAPRRRERPPGRALQPALAGAGAEGRHPVAPNSGAGRRRDPARSDAESAHPEPQVRPRPAGIQAARKWPASSARTTRNTSA